MRMNPITRLGGKSRGVLNAFLMKGTQGGNSAIQRMTPAEAFAVIPLAAVCADHKLQPEEADLVMSQLRGRRPYSEMDPVAFGTMISSLLMALRDRRQALVEEAATHLSTEQQEKAFALAARLVHADRIATQEEANLLIDLRCALSVPVERLEEIEASIALLSQDS